MKRGSIGTVVVGAALVGCLAGAYMWISAAGHRLHSPPSAPPGPPAYPPAPEDSPGDVGSLPQLDSIGVEWRTEPWNPTGKQRTFTLPAGLNKRANDRPKDEVRFEADKTATFEDMTFRLVGIGIVEIPERGSDTKPQVDWYGPDLKPFAEPMPAWTRNGSGGISYGNTAQYRVRLGVEGGRNVDLVRAFWREPGSGAVLGRAFTNFQPAGALVMTLGYAPWRPMPVELVVDLAFGDLLSADLAPTSGTLFEVGGREGIVLEVAAGNLPSYSSTTRMDKTTVSLGDLVETDSCVTIVLAGRGFSLSQWIDVEALDRKGGTPARFHGSMESVPLMSSSFRLRLEDLGGIRVSTRSRSVRLVIEFPDLPGLPPENRAVADLFDLRIPRVENRHAREVEELIARTTNFRIRHEGGFDFPTAQILGPSESRDVTPRDLVEKVKAVYGAETACFVDTRKREILFVHPQPQGGNPFGGPRPSWLRRLVHRLLY